MQAPEDKSISSNKIIMKEARILGSLGPLIQPGSRHSSNTETKVHGKIVNINMTRER